MGRHREDHARNDALHPRPRNESRLRQEPDILAALRRLQLAQDRLDAAWRRRHGLNPNEQLVLVRLAEGMTAAPTDLSRAIGITTAGMTNLIDRLEADGYVRRERHQSDGRRVILSLTKKGLRAHFELERASEPATAAFDALRESERRQVVALLDEAARSLESTEVDT